MPKEAIPEEVTHGGGHTTMEEATQAEAITEEVHYQEEATQAEAITEEDIPEDEAIMDEAITTVAEVRESSLADTSGSPTIIRTVTLITTLTGMRIPLTPIRIRNLKRILTRGNLLTGITVGIQKVITRT